MREYFKPEISEIEIETADVIRTSGFGEGDFTDGDFEMGTPVLRKASDLL